MIRKLLFPGKKPKEIIEDGGDDEIDTDPDSGKKKDDGDVKGWYDGHPEIGKMQKDIFDDIFDTTDDGVTDEDDPSPIIPKPQDFEVNFGDVSWKRIKALACCLLSNSFHLLAFLTLVSLLGTLDEFPNCNSTSVACHSSIVPIHFILLKFLNQ